MWNFFLHIFFLSLWSRILSYNSMLAWPILQKQNTVIRIKTTYFICKNVKTRLIFQGPPTCLLSRSQNFGHSNKICILSVITSKQIHKEPAVLALKQPHLKSLWQRPMFLESTLFNHKFFWLSCTFSIPLKYAVII